MKVLLIGGGGREHAVAEAFARSGAELYSIMKNRNPGIARLAKEVRLAEETDMQAVCDFASKVRPDIAHVGPEAPLEVGAVEKIEALGIPCASPESGAARIETSKEFMRNLMAKYRLRGSIRFGLYDNIDDAMGKVDELGSVAIKPIGLTGGKGVKVTGDQMKDRGEIVAYVREVLEKKVGGQARVLVEEKLEGEEFTLQGIADGNDIAPTPLVQDHKRLLDGDLGPNTGGMGSYSCEDHLLPFVGCGDRDAGLEIMKDVMGAMNKEGLKFKGVLYGQFMLTRDGPKVVEFNARFADPESMNILTILESPMTDLMEAAATGKLSKVKPMFAKRATVCRYTVPKGYGLGSPRAGVEVQVDEQALRGAGCAFYYAAVDERDGKVYTTRSRTVGVVGVGDDLMDAEKRCTEGMKHVKGDLFYRKDIGTQNLIKKRIEHLKQIREN
jgi:phosphoribosylamine--glycine ligase